MSENDKIVSGQGLFKQIQKTNIHPYHKFSLEGLIEITDEWALTEWRNRLLNSISVDMFTVEEHEHIKAMIWSDDQENIYMAEQIINFKKNEGKEKN
jgi:hypothetical protein